MEYNSTIDKGAIINIPNSLSFNFSKVNFSSNKWCSLLSIPISSLKVAIYSRLGYSLALKCFYYLYTLSILQGTYFTLLYPYSSP